MSGHSIYVMKFEAIAKGMMPDYVIDGSNVNEIDDIMRYFCFTPDGKLSVKKGLLLCGNVGTGKTTMFKIFSRVIADLKYSYEFRIYPSHIIVQDFMKNGYDGFDKYTKGKIMDTYYGDRMVNTVESVIDDLGMEQKVSYYGTSTDITGELLLRRYEMLISSRIRTHATTNLTTAELKDRYGARIYDRMKEMFNIIPLMGESRRY